MTIKPYDESQCQGGMLQGYTGCLCNYCQWFASQEGKWIVDVKGSADRGGEITVLRENNRHGRASYGWCGPNKLKVLSTQEETCTTVWNSALETAETIKDAFNLKEKK